MKIATIFTIPLFWGIVAASPPFRESNEKVGDLSNLNYREQYKEKIPDLGRIVLNEDKADDYAKAKIWKRSLFEILKKDSILNKKGDEDKKDHGLVLNGLKLGKRIVHRAIEALSKLVGNGNLDKRSLKSEELDKLTDIVPGNEPHDVKKRENIKLLNVRDKNAEDANGKKNKLEKSLKESSGPGSREKIQAKKEEIFNSIPTITVHKEQKKLESGNKKKDDDSTNEKENRSSPESLLNVQRNKRGTSTSLWNFYDKDSQEVNDLVTGSHVSAVLKNRYASVAEAMNSGVAIERILQQANENVAKVQDLDDDFQLEKFNNEFNKWLADSLEDSFDHLEHFDHHLPTYIKVQQKQARQVDYKNPYRTRAESRASTQTRASRQDVPYVKPRSYENSDFPWQYNENSRYDNKRSSDDTRSIWQSPSDKKNNKYDNRLSDRFVPQVSRENPYGVGENVKNNVPWEGNRNIKQDNHDGLDWGYPNRYGERSENSAATAVGSSSANSRTVVDDIYKNTYIPSSWFVDDRAGNNNNNKREEARKSWNNIDYATATLAPPLATNNARNNAHNYEKFLPSHWLVDETIEDNDHHVVPHNQPMISNVPIIADERRRYDSFSLVNNVGSPVQARTIATAKATPAKERNDKETNRPIDFLKSTLAIEGIKSPSVTKLASVPDEWLVDEEALKQNSRSNAIVAVTNFAGVPLADRNKYGSPAFRVNDEIINTEDDARSSASAGAGANTSAGTSAGASVGVLHQRQDTNPEKSVNKANSGGYAPVLDLRDFGTANNRPGEFNGGKYKSSPWSVNDKPLQNVPLNWLTKQPVASSKPNNEYKVPSITLGGGKEDQENYKPLIITKPVVVPVNEQKLQNVPREIASGKVHTVSNVKPDVEESPIITGQYPSDGSRKTDQDTRENKNELPQESISPHTPTLAIANHQKNIPNHWLPEKAKGKEYDVPQWQNKNPVASDAPVNTFDGLAGPSNVANADVSSFSPINHEQFALGKKERTVNDENIELPIAKTNVEVLPQTNAVDEGKQRPHPLNLESSNVQEGTIADILQTAKDTNAETLKQDNEEVRPRIVDDKTVWANADSDAAAFGSASTGVTEGSSTINQERKNLEWSSEDESPKGDKKSALFANANAGGDGAAKADVSTSDNNESNDKEIVTGHSVTDVVEDKNAENRNNAVTVAEANTNTIAAVNDKYENNGKSESTTRISEDDILKNENDSNAKVLASTSNDINDQVDDNGKANDEVRETSVNNENGENSINVLQDKVEINKNNAITQPLTSVSIETDSQAEQLRKEDQNPKEKDTNYSDTKLPVKAANVDAISESDAKPTDHWEAKPLNKDLENDNNGENNDASAKSSASASASSNNHLNENIENQDSGMSAAVAHPEENRHINVPTQSGEEKDLSQEREENNLSLKNVPTNDESSASASASAEAEVVNPADKGYKQLQEDSKGNENEEKAISVVEANAGAGSQASDIAESNEEQELSQERPEGDSSLEKHDARAEALATVSTSSNVEVDNHNENQQNQSENNSKQNENKDNSASVAEANATAENEASNPAQSNEEKELPQERPGSDSSSENHDAGAESLATASASANTEVDNNNKNQQNQSENNSKQNENKENTVTIAEANATAESEANHPAQSNEEKELPQERPGSDSSSENHDAGAESLATASASSNAEVDNNNENQRKQLENESKQNENKENTVSVAEANATAKSQASNSAEDNDEKDLSQERPESDSSSEKYDTRAKSSAISSANANAEVDNYNESQQKQLESDSEENKSKESTVAVAEANVEVETKASDLSTSNAEQNLLQEQPEDKSSWNRSEASAESSASASSSANAQVTNHSEYQQKQLEEKSKEIENTGTTAAVAEASAEAESHASNSFESSEEQDVLQEHTENNSYLENVGAGAESSASVSTNSETLANNRVENDHKQLESDSKENRNEENAISVAEASAEPGSQGTDSSQRSEEQEISQEQTEKNSSLEKHGAAVESNALASASADTQVENYSKDHQKELENDSKEQENKENTLSVAEANATAESQASDSIKNSEKQDLLQKQSENDSSLVKYITDESSVTSSATADAGVDTSVTNEHKQSEAVSEENTISADETNAEVASQVNDISKTSVVQGLSQEQPDNNSLLKKNDAGTESSTTASATADAEVDTSVTNEHKQSEEVSEGNRNEANAISTGETNAETESQSSNSSGNSEEQELSQERRRNNLSLENVDAGAESSASASASADAEVETSVEEKDNQLEGHSEAKRNDGNALLVAEINDEAENQESNSSESQESYSSESQENYSSESQESYSSESQESNSSESSEEQELSQKLTENNSSSENHDAAAESNASASASADTHVENFSENNEKKLEYNSNEQESEVKTVSVAEVNAADASETIDSSARSTEGELHQGLTENRNNWDKNDASAESSALASSSATSQAVNHSENQQEQLEDNSPGKENRENTVAVAEANAEAQSQASGSLETSEKEEQSQGQQEEQNSWNKNDASAESSASASANAGTNIASHVENEQKQWERDSEEKRKEETAVSVAQANAEAESQASESTASGGKEELHHERPENKITSDKSDTNEKSSAFTSTSADAYVVTRTEDRHKQLEGDYKGIENEEKAVSAAETHADTESQVKESSASSGETELHHEGVENEVSWDKSDASVESSASASTSAGAQVIDHSVNQQEQLEEYSEERDTSQDTVAEAEANVVAESQTNDSAGSNERQELTEEQPDDNLSLKLHSAGAESAATASATADAQSVDHNENHQKQLENVPEKKENHENAVSVAEANAKAESQVSDLTAVNIEKELPQERPEDKNTWDRNDNVVESSASASSSANTQVTNHSENQEQLKDTSKERVNNGNTVAVAEANAEGESQSSHSSENNEEQDLIQERPENNSPLVIHNVGSESTATASANSDAQSINHSESNQQHLEGGSENKENEESTVSVAEVNAETESQASGSSDSSTEEEIPLGQPEDKNTWDRNHASVESSATASSSANVQVADHSDNQQEQLEENSKERENSLNTVAVAGANAESESHTSDSTEINVGKDLVLESQKYNSHLEKHDVTAESLSSTTAHSETYNVNHNENHQKELESVSKKEENEEKAVSTAEANAFADSHASDLSARGGENVLSQEHLDYKSLLVKDVVAETSTSESVSAHTQVSNHNEGQVVQQEKDTEEKTSVDREVSITEVHTEAISSSSLTGEEGNQSQARSKDNTFSDNNSFTAESSASASATADSSVKNHNDDQREQLKDGWSDERNVDKVVSAAEANSEVNSQASGSPSSGREREESPKLPEDNNTWDKNDASVVSSASSSVSAESQVNNHSEDLHNQLEGYSDEKGNVDGAVLIDEANAGSNSEANGQTTGPYLNREDNNGEENRELPQDSLGDVTSSGNNDVGAESLAAVSVGADSQVNSHSENEHKTLELVSKERENVDNTALVTEANAETGKASKYDDIVVQESEASGYGSSNVNDVSLNERRNELPQEDSSVAVSNVKSAVNVDDSANVVVASTTSAESVSNDKVNDQYKSSDSLLEQNNEKDNVNVEVNVKDIPDAGFTSLHKDNIDSSTIQDTNDSSAHSSGFGSTSTNSEVHTEVSDNYKQSEQNSGQGEENTVNEVASTAEANSSSTTKSESDTNYEAIDNASQVTITDKESRSALVPVKNSITEEHENIQSDWKLDTHDALINQDIASSVTSSSNEVDSKASSVTSERQNSSEWRLKEDSIQDNENSVHTETSSSESVNAESHSVTEIRESKSEQITDHEYNQNRDDSTVAAEKSVSAATEASTSAIAESGAYSSSEAKDDVPLLSKKSNEVSSKEENGFSEWTTPAGDASHSESKIPTLADADAKIAPVSVYEYIHSKTKPDDKEVEWRKSVESDSARSDETDSGKLVDENNHAEVKEDNNSITDSEVISSPEVIASSNIESDLTSTSKDEEDKQNKEELDSVNTANDLLTNDGTTGNIENGGPRVSSEKEKEEQDTNADSSTDTRVDNVQNISDDRKEDGWLIKWKLNDHTLPITAINENGAREISQEVGPIIPSTATSDVPEGKVSKKEIEKSEADLIVMRKQYGRRKPISITYMKNSIAPMVVYRVIPKSVYEQVRNLIKQGAIVHTAYGQARTPKT